MTNALLQQWMAHPELLDQDSLAELRACVARYPYFQTARLLYLKNLRQLRDAAWGDELRRAVLLVADRRKLFHLLEDDRYRLRPASLQPRQEADDRQPEPSVDRTLFLIDSFLSAMPDEPQPQAAGLDYAMDYASYLLAEDQAHPDDANGQPLHAPRLKGQELIDDFLHRDETSAHQPLLPDTSDLPQPEETPAELPAADDSLDDSFFTETLAKIYIRQRRYDKALEIIKKLSLNYPKKSTYFADQIQELEKQITNAKSK